MTTEASDRCKQTFQKSDITNSGDLQSHQVDFR